MFTLALVTVAMLHLQADRPEAETPLLPPNAYLVKARVVSVDEAKDFAADFVIEEVYVGESSLKGQHFTLSDYMLRGGSQVNPKIHCPLRRGGSWALVGGTQDRGVIGHWVRPSPALLIPRLRPCLTLDILSLPGGAEGR